MALTLSLTCCKGDSREREQERAGQTAKAYYALLLEGKYSDFVLGMDGGDSLPDGYRQQMEANAAMFVEQQKTEHKGIKSIEYSHCHADSTLCSAEAFLTITYEDKTQETICVPMVQRNDIWYMK